MSVEMLDLCEEMGVCPDEACCDFYDDELNECAVLPLDFN